MTKKNTEFKDFKIYVPFALKGMGDMPSGDMSGDMADGEEILKIEGYANFSGSVEEDCADCYIDLANEVVVPGGFDLSVWKKNPQILWQHDREYTIGKGIKATKKADGLFISAEIHQAAMEEEDYYRVKNGLVSFFSVGFRTKAAEWKEINKNPVYFITKALLLEVSVVSIPCNSESGFSVVKALGDEGFYGGELKENKKEEIQEPVKENGEDKMKIKLVDFLSEDEAGKLKSLGLDPSEEKEVDIATYIEYAVSKKLESIHGEIKELKEEVTKLKPVEETDEEKAEREAKEKELADKEAEEKAAKELEEKELEETVAQLKEAIETFKKELATE